MEFSLRKFRTPQSWQEHVTLSVVTCGTSMLSVGRMVASLLLRGSNSNAAVRTMANPGIRRVTVKFLSLLCAECADTWFFCTSIWLTHVSCSCWASCTWNAWRAEWCWWESGLRCIGWSDTTTCPVTEWGETKWADEVMSLHRARVSWF